MTFRKGNKIRYGQDHAFREGIPHGVDFHVSRFGDGLYELRAPGYGVLKPGQYGNGSLVAYGLTASQRRQFEEAARQHTMGTIA